MANTFQDADLSNHTPSVPDRTDLLLGVTSIALRDFNKLGALIHIDLDSISDENSAAFNQFRSVVPDTEISNEDLRARGKAAREAGVAVSVTERTVKFDDGSIIHVLPKWDMTFWNAIEHTLDSSRGNFLARLSSYPAWTNNSCALDASISHGFTAGLFVRQADAISFRTRCEMRPIPAMYRMILEEDWPNISKPIQNGYRRLLSKALQDNPRVNYTAGQFVDANEIVTACMEGAPSLSYTSTIANRCCSERLMFTRDGHVGNRRTTHQISLRAVSGGIEEVLKPGQSIANIIQDQWFPYSARGDTKNINRDTFGNLRTPMEPCEKGQACTQLYDVATCIFEEEEMPPMFHVVIEGGGRHTEIYRGYTEPLTLRTCRIVGPSNTELIETTYDPVSIITWHSGHFTTTAKVYNGPKPFAHIDGMASKPEAKANWLDLIPGTDIRIMSLIYIIRLNKDGARYTPVSPGSP